MGMRSPSARRILLVLSLLFIFSCLNFTVADAQNLPQLSAPSNPSNVCGCSKGDDAIPVSSGMLTPFLPTIPNLEFGFLYYFGNRVSTGRFTADYVLPFHLSADSVLFGEAHAEGWGFWKRPHVPIAAAPGFTVTTSDTSNRLDLSLGGGYRTMLGPNTLLGVNGFYDGSSLFNQWYSSGGVGLEYAANVAGDDAVDLNFNWYGNLFNRDVLINAFRNKGNSFDVEAGYSHAMFNRALDLRLKVIGYQFGIGTGVYGWRGGADLTTRDGVFTVRYEYGHDRIDGYYNTVGGFVNIGFQMENLLNGESPFTLPEPVFRSPRNLWRLLGQKVKRNWYQPEAVVVARATCPNLQGSMVGNGTSIGTDTFLILTPATPQVLTRFAVLCWCSLETPATLTAVQLLDDTATTLFLSAQTVDLTTPAGCATLFANKAFVIFRPAVRIVLDTDGVGEELGFGPGGGISIQVNQ